MSDQHREFDVIVYGASGFVGALVARYLARHAPRGTRIALAGRDAAKLERLGLDLPVVLADANDEESLTTMAGRARVVVTTVGPYAKYGRALARACAATGTDYVDLTGEVLFARDSVDENHETARRTGARIVHSCGFDSIPSDIGVHVLHAAVTADGEGELTDTTLVVTRMRGGVSGGTIDSIRHQVDMMKKDTRLRRVGASPYSLSPDRESEPDLGRQPDMLSLPGSDVDPSIRGHLAPFVMASYNTRVVRRSNALRDWAYGRRFRYREVLRVRNRFAATTVKTAISALVAGFAVPPLRFVLDRVLPAPGAGPSEEVQRNGHFTTDIFTTTTSGARYRARVKAKGDPGYAATAIMLGEAALALVHDRDRLPSLGGGVLTPATGIGDALADRLRTAGLEITARRL